MSLEHPSIDDWVCAEHNVRLALLKGKAACGFYREHADRDPSVSPWIEPSIVETLWNDRSKMYRTVNSHSTVLRNRFVNRASMLASDHVVEAALVQAEEQSRRGLETPRRVYWHLFAVPGLDLPMPRLYGPTYADADSVIPEGDTVIRLGMVTGTGSEREQDASPWAGGWYSCAAEPEPPSRELIFARFQEWFTEQFMLSHRQIRTAHEAKEAKRNGTTPIH